MKTRICTLALTLAPFAAIAALSGCVQSSPRFDSGFGTSVRTSLAAQVADPAAASNTDPVTGIDGRAAAAGQQRYEQSFTRPSEPQSVISGQRR